MRIISILFFDHSKFLLAFLHGMKSYVWSKIADDLKKANRRWWFQGSMEFYSVSSIRLRTVFISFNNILISECAIFILWFVSVGTPSTSSFFSLNVMQAQSMVSFGTSYFISTNSFTGIWREKVNNLVLKLDEHRKSKFTR